MEAIPRDTPASEDPSRLEPRRVQIHVEVVEASKHVKPTRAIVREPQTVVDGRPWRRKPLRSVWPNLPVRAFALPRSGQTNPHHLPLHKQPHPLVQPLVQPKPLSPKGLKAFSQVEQVEQVSKLFRKISTQRKRQF